jgi:transcriptional regulator with XRE-family HTH domain
MKPKSPNPEIPKSRNPLKTLRRAAALTQIEAAERAGVAQCFWARVECRPDLDGTSLATLRRFALALDVPLERLTSDG